jgi:predicted secreted protein
MQFKAPALLQIDIRDKSTTSCTWAINTQQGEQITEQHEHVAVMLAP